jgi:hypothetical protein
MKNKHHFKTKLKMTFQDLHEIALCISECGLDPIETIDYIESVAPAYVLKKKVKTYNIEKHGTDALFSGADAITFDLDVPF